jgi:hypothetical protein
MKSRVLSQRAKTPITERSSKQVQTQTQTSQQSHNLLAFHTADTTPTPWDAAFDIRSP